MFTSGNIAQNKKSQCFYKQKTFEMKNETHRKKAKKKEEKNHS